MRLSPRVRRHALLPVCALAATFVFSTPVDAGQTPPAPAAGTLRIDVQVVDGDGQPVPGLTPDKFNVEVNGDRRRVLDATVVDSGNRDTSGPLEGRSVYFLVVDASTFGPGASSDASAALTTFVETLPDESLLGLVTFPAGPAVELTTDHASIAAAVAGIAGHRQEQRSGSYGVGLADAVEYGSSANPDAIVRDHCGETLAEDNACPQLLEQEVNVVLNLLETRARASLGMVADFAGRLGAIPGRKVLVLVSAGMPVAERTGGRPSVGNLPSELAEAVTRSDVAFYTLLLDGLQASDQAQNARQASNASRNRELQGRWLDQFSSSMGGALVRVVPGQDTEGYDRIARETGSHYMLTVESADADVEADRPQRLRVRVDQRGATVRARTLVKGR